MKRSPNHAVLSLMGLVCAAVSLPAPRALAQTEKGDTVTLAPVLVSVLRSPVRLDRLPFSASVMAGPEFTEGTAGLFIEEALHALPGVRVQNRYNASVGERISIRGFGARSQFGVRGIKILVDGIPATLPDGQTTLDHLDVGSLGRVEALRGPAPTVWSDCRRRARGPPVGSVSAPASRAASSTASETTSPSRERIRTAGRNEPRSTPPWHRRPAAAR